jgi:phage terminase large subunit-like protein
MTEIKKRAKAPARNWKFTHSLSQEELSNITIHAPLSIKQEKFLNDEENTIVVWGGAAGAGKSQMTLLKILIGAMWDADYVAGVARESQKQMKLPGSLWSTGTKMFTPMGISSNKVELQWNFPNGGAEVKCHHLSDNQDDWQGSQMTVAIVDEAQLCREDDVWYLISRLRSRSKQKSQLMLTCNPLNTSFLCDWLVRGGYVGEDGLPVKDMDGKTTYMIQIGGRFEWFKDKQSLIETYGQTTANFALKFVYYSANVYDNPYIRKFQPEYINNLENLKDTERRRLLLGDWFAKMEGQGFITESQFNKCSLSQIPLHTPSMRAWDIAGTAPHPANKDPDWTRGVLGTYDKESGCFYIKGMKSLRENSAAVQNLIETTAFQDGKAVYVSIPIDSGAAGRTVADQKKARLLQLGVKVVLEPTRASKLVRAEGFLMAVQTGKVFVADGVFSKEDFREIEAFDGDKCAGLHDDIIDALASCYNNLVSGNLIPTIRISRNSDTNKNHMGLGGSTLLSQIN